MIKAVLAWTRRFFIPTTGWTPGYDTDEDFENRHHASVAVRSNRCRGGWSDLGRYS